MIAHRFYGKFTVLSAAILLSSISACVGSADKPDVKIPRMSEEQAESISREYARQIVEGIGATKVERAPSTNVSSCGNLVGGDSSAKHFWVTHIQNLAVPPQKQEATFLQARTIIEGLGFQTKKFATSSAADGGSGNLRAVKSADGFSVALESTSPSVEIMIMISSPCLERSAE